MKKILCFLILIFGSFTLLVACDKDDTTITETNLDFSVELESDNSVLEVFTLNLDCDEYTDLSSMYQNKELILSYFVYDTTYYLAQFDRLVQQSTSLSDEIKEEYLTRKPIDYEEKLINNSTTLQFEMSYKNNNMRQVWYFFIQTYDPNTNTGIILDYNDPLIFGNPTTGSTLDTQCQEGTWFNKEYILTTSFYDYAFIPYPTFKENFVDIRDDVTYTQTVVSVNDSLKTNAYMETKVGDMVIRTWVINLSDETPIEYYVLQANRSNWYILCLGISIGLILLMFVFYGIHVARKKRQSI